MKIHIVSAHCQCFILLALFFLGSNIIGFSQGLPIRPTRTLSFDTDEGTNMNVDVSPDGKTLLFDLVGDLYSVSTAGGHATQLTRVLAINFRPIWSPNGKRFAYISDFSGSLHLNIRDITGNFHMVLGKFDDQLNYFSTPLWTPDGNYIVIDGNIYGLMGGGCGSFIDIRNLMRFSLNGKFEYYKDSGRIYKYDRASNSKVNISSVVKRSQGEVLSPDGRYWAYIIDSNSRKCLIVQDLITYEERILVPSLFMKYPFYNQYIQLHYAFSHDSKSLFIGYGGKIHRINVESGEDRVIPFYAHVKADTGSFDYNNFRVSHDSVRIRYIRSANASPDGKHLVFSALDKLYIMDLANGKTRLLVDQPMGQFQPIYSPDGKWIAYVSWSDTAGGYLWRVLALGGQPEQLADSRAQYQRPAWSPDGGFIAVVKGDPKLGDRDDPGIGQLELIPVNGSSATVIDNSIPLWNQLAFSPDGKRLIYQPERLKGYPFEPLLVSKDVNGKDFQVLVAGKTGLTFSYISHITVSPDDRFIIYSMG